MLKPRKQVTYLISSHLNYCEYTAGMVLNSLLSQISQKDIIFVIGGCASPPIQLPVRTEVVSHNSFDYTALVWLIESSFRQSNYVFLLHDTMRCGPRFRELTLAGAIGTTAMMAHPKGFCNLGMYNVEHLHSISPSILKARDITKSQAIALEGRLCKRFEVYPNSTVIRQDNSKQIYSNVGRTVDYYPSVDVYKYGANHLANIASDTFINEP